MALDQTVQVDLPKHGIAYKKISGKTYVYYVTAAYRNEKGKPTNDRVSIGRLDEGVKSMGALPLTDAYGHTAADGLRRRVDGLEQGIPVLEVGELAIERIVDGIGQLGGILEVILVTGALQGRA